VHKVATVATMAVLLLVLSIAPAFADIDPIPRDTGAGISVSSVSVSGGSGGGGSGGRACTYQQANVPGDPSTELTITPDLTQQQGTKNRPESRSQRTCSRLKQLNHDSARSTRQR
jgi:hypothetical protein